MIGRWIGRMIIGGGIVLGLWIGAALDAQQANTPPSLPRELVLQREVDDLTAQVRTLEFELAGCRGQLTPYAQQIASEIQKRRADWKAAVEKALGPAWTVNDRGDVVATKAEQKP